MPDAIYLFDPTEIDGRLVSIHIVIDSAKLTIMPTGRYAHSTWVGEWEGEVGGPPQLLKYRTALHDHGSWQREGFDLTFDSAWLQNHRMHGTFGLDGVLRMLHGVTHEDRPAEFQYERSAEEPGVLQTYSRLNRLGC